MSTVVVARARARMRSVMLDTVTITRTGGEWVFNPETGLSEPPEPATVYTGPCKVRSRNVVADTPLAAGQEITVHPYEVALPVTATAVQVGDLCYVDDSQDPGAVGKYLTVESVRFGTFAAARRLLCSHDQG